MIKFKRKKQTKSTLKESPRASVASFFWELAFHEGWKKGFEDADKRWKKALKNNNSEENTKKMVKKIMEEAMNKAFDFIREDTLFNKADKKGGYDA